MMDGRRRSLMGLEKEYAAVGIGEHGQPLSHDEVAKRLYKKAGELYTHLQCISGGMGMWLGNGSRFYIDSGAHPEWTTPETGDPWETLRYERAADQMIQRTAEQLNAEDNDDTFRIHVNNTDYRAGTTWGSHESYQYRCEQKHMTKQITPLLVGRVVLNGAGGLQPRSYAPVFSLSPKVAALHGTTSGDSTRNRAIVHLKQEPLAGGGYHRLHLLCGESLRSDVASVLRVGLTSLAVAMIDGGVKPAVGVSPRKPLEAMQQFAADPTCKARVVCRDRRRRTAIDIVRHYVTLAERHEGESFMPSWSARLIELANTWLDALETDVANTAVSLDWSIKHALFTQHVEDRGFTWEQLAEYEKQAKERPVPSRSRDELLEGLSPSVRSLLEGRTPPRGFGAPRERLKAIGLSDDEATDVQRLHSELHEIDWRFGQLGPASLFDALDSAGVLNHRLVDQEEVDQATVKPPSIERAAVRGRMVAEHAGTDGLFAVDWSLVVDHQTRKYLDLTDPFTPSTEWQEEGSGELGPDLMHYREMYRARRQRVE